VGRTVNGLPIPGALCDAIADRRGRPPAEDVLRAVLGDEPDFARFYDLAEMTRQSARLLIAPKRSYDWVPAGWDRRRTVIIGSLGADMPVALDYRQSRSRPQVLYLGLDGWVVVAPDAETLPARLGLEP
jgi:hypothetical protein